MAVKNGWKDPAGGSSNLMGGRYGSGIDSLRLH